MERQINREELGGEGGGERSIYVNPYMYII